MKTMPRSIVTAFVVLISACRFDCGPGSQCGSGNVISPTTVTTTGATPTPTPAPGALAPCVAQLGAFVCARGAPTLLGILQEVQGTVTPAPEAIYVPALVAALNRHASVCAVAGPSPDEITIKARVSNATSEGYDVVRADGAAQALYVETCSPSRF